MRAWRRPADRLPGSRSAYETCGHRSAYVDGDEVSTGSGAACLGNPLPALAWLARTSAAYGQLLRAGEIGLSVALGPMVPVRPNSTVRAQSGDLGAVTATFRDHNDSCADG